MVGRLAEGEIAQGALVDSPDGLDVELVRPGLEIDEEAEPLFSRLAAALFDRDAAGHVDGDRLGDIDMLARGDAGGGLLGMKVRRRLDHQGIDARIEHPLVTLQAREAARRGDAELVAAPVDPVLEVVGHRGELVSAMLLEQVGDPGAPAAAAGQADPHLGIGLVASGGLRRDHRRRGHRRARQKAAARNGTGARTLVGLASNGHGLVPFIFSRACRILRLRCSDSNHSPCCHCCKPARIEP